MCDGIGRKTLTEIAQMPSNFVEFILQLKRLGICFPNADIISFTRVSSGLFSSDDVVNGVDHRRHNVCL